MIVEYGDNAIWFFKEPASILTHSVLANSSSCAIGVYASATNTVDFTAAALGNTFPSNANGEVCVD